MSMIGTVGTYNYYTLIFLINDILVSYQLPSNYDNAYLRAIMFNFFLLYFDNKLPRMLVHQIKFSL